VTQARQGPNVTHGPIGTLQSICCDNLVSMNLGKQEKKGKGTHMDNKHFKSRAELHDELSKRVFF